MRLHCPTLDWSVLLETALSHCVPKETTMYYWDNPTLDYPVQYENTLSHMRRLNMSLHWLDCYVSNETALSYMRLHCPTWDCTVLHETAQSYMTTTRKKVLPFIAKVLLSWDWFVLLGSGTWMGLVLGRDWDLNGTMIKAWLKIWGRNTAQK